MPKFLSSIRSKGSNDHTGASQAVFRQNIIKDISVLQTGTFGGVVKYILTPGYYLFDTDSGTPLLLDHPFYLDDSAGGTISIVINCIVTFADNVAVFDQAIGNFLFLRINDSLFFGTNPAAPSVTKTLFNLSYSSVGAKPVALINFVQPVLFASIGTLQTFDTVLLTNFSIRNCSAGITLNNIENTISMGPCNFQASLNPNCDYVTISGASSPSVQATLINFIPSSVNEDCFLISSTTPSVSIGNSIYDTRIVGGDFQQFFDDVGLDQTSPYVSCSNVKNVPDSTIALKYYWNGSQTRVVEVTNQWHTVPTGNTPITDIAQRMTIDSRQIVTSASFERELCELYCGASLNSSGGANRFEIGWFDLTTPASTTADAVLNTFTQISPVLANNDLVLFNATSMPAPLLDVRVYFVVQATGGTFKVSATQGGAEIDLTTAGTSVQVSKVTLDSYTNVVSANATTQTISFKVIDTLTLNKKHIVLFRNVEGTSDLTFTSVTLSVRS